MENIQLYLNNLDRAMTANIVNSKGFHPRPRASNGLWCMFLIPSTFFLALYKLPGCPNYLKLASSQAVGVLIESMFFVVYGTISPEYLNSGSSLMSGLFAYAFSYVLLGDDFFFSIIMSFSVPYVFNKFLCTLLKRIPKTFSIGEAFIVAQAFTYWISTTMYLVYDAYRVETWDDLETMRMICMIGMSTVLLFIALITSGIVEFTPERFLFAFIGTFSSMVVYMHYLLGFSPILWMINYLFFNQRNRTLLLVWAGIVVLTIILTIGQVELGRATIITRKMFHLTASMVFTSGALFEVRLLKLAACVTLAIILMLELFRKTKMTPLATTLQKTFDSYADDRDMRGGTALTPICLFVGLCIPLSLPTYDADVLLLSGVLSIGIGDSVASYVGSNYGKLKIESTGKTLEGTFANMCSQFIFVFFISLLGLLKPSVTLYWRAALAAVISAIVEASTDQIDNLVVPIITTQVLLITL